MARINKPTEMRALQPEEIYVEDRTRMFGVPAVAEGVKAVVGWDGATSSYFFLMVRTSVSHLDGAFDHYLGRQVEIDDLYWAGGLMADPPSDALPELGRHVDTLVELVHWTWDEINWRAAEPRVLVELRDARDYEQTITMRDMMPSPRTTQSTDWFISTFFDYPNHVDRRMA